MRNCLEREFNDQFLGCFQGGKTGPIKFSSLTRKIRKSVPQKSENRTRGRLESEWQSSLPYVHENMYVRQAMCQLHMCDNILYAYIYIYIYIYIYRWIRIVKISLSHVNLYRVNGKKGFITSRVDITRCNMRKSSNKRGSRN